MMKLVISVVIFSCAVWQTRGYPAQYPYYGTNMDSLSYGDGTRGGMVLSRYYNPYYNPHSVGGGMAAFMVREPQEQAQPQASQYYLPDRRRQTQPEINFVPPQQNEVYTPQQNEVFTPQQNEIYVRQHDKPLVTEATEIVSPTERAEVIPTTVKAIIPEIIEPEIEEVEEPASLPKKNVLKPKQAKRPIEEDDEYTPPKLPAGTFFPMFFGWGGGRSGGAPGGATAIANAYSTGRGGVATSHATAYGEPRPEYTKSS